MASQLSTAMLECFLVELLPILQREELGESTDWLSKDITMQLVKVCFGDMLSNVCEEMLKLIDSDDRWMHHLTTLRHYLWPETERNDKLMNVHVEMHEKTNAARMDDLSFNIKQHDELIKGL